MTRHPSHPFARELCVLALYSALCLTLGVLLGWHLHAWWTRPPAVVVGLVGCGAAQALSGERP